MDRTACLSFQVTTCILLSTDMTLEDDLLLDKQKKEKKTVLTEQKIFGKGTLTNIFTLCFKAEFQYCLRKKDRVFCLIKGVH